MIVSGSARSVRDYLSESTTEPLFVQGDALDVLSDFPDESIDFCMTSPPYWGQRDYAAQGMGQEATPQQYVENLASIFAEVHRVLKPTGSFWLNIGDAYASKRLLGIPWRVAIHLTDSQGWILRNDVVWNKVKGAPDNAKDKLRCIHEYVFHFVKRPIGYFYDVDAIRSSPGKTKVINGSIVSATGVSGIRYKRQIELSTALSENEKHEAFGALRDMLRDMELGRVSDFRMIIRGQQRATHSDVPSVSGRARELVQKGFYFLKYHPNGSKPGDVWDIVPEDTQNRGKHFAPYPEDLCKIPLLSTCPPDGIALDPFCGTGTTMFVAYTLGRKSIGIDTCEEYLRIASDRCHLLV